MSNMVINTNVLALNSHRAGKNVATMQSKASSRLSSGLKINSAADDAAGLAISEKMRSQIRGLDMSSKNSQDAISLIQTAEGGMQEIDNMLQRVRELAVQVSNDTNEHNKLGTGDRQKIQDEVNQLVTEIDSMAERVEFNKKKVINGSFSDPQEIFDSASKNLDIVKAAKVQSAAALQASKEVYSGKPEDAKTIQSYKNLVSLRPVSESSLASKNLAAATALNAKTGAGVTAINGKIGTGATKIPTGTGTENNLNMNDIVTALKSVTDAALTASINSGANNGDDKLTVAANVSAVRAILNKLSTSNSFGANDAVLEELKVYQVVKIGSTTTTGLVTGEFVDLLQKQVGMGDIRAQLSANRDVNDTKTIGDMEVAVETAIKDDASATFAYESANAAVNDTTNGTKAKLTAATAAATAAKATLANHKTTMSQMLPATASGTPVATVASVVDKATADQYIASLTANDLTGVGMSSAAAAEIFDAKGADRLAALENLSKTGNAKEQIIANALLDLHELASNVKTTDDAQTAAATADTAAKKALSSAITLYTTEATRVTTVKDRLTAANDAYYKSSKVDLPIGGTQTFNSKDDFDTKYGDFMAKSSSQNKVSAFEEVIASKKALIDAYEAALLKNNGSEDSKAKILSTKAALEDSFKNVNVAGKTLANKDAFDSAYASAIKDNNIAKNTYEAAVKEDATNEGLVTKFTEQMNSAQTKINSLNGKKQSLHFQVGANANQSMEMSIGSVKSDILGIGDGNGNSTINVLKDSGRDITAMLDTLDNALSYVTTERSKLGAAQNRLEYTIKSLDISSENLSAAESRIRDTDMAKEMMNLTKSNVLQQAATAMLAQANQAPQQVLQLLR